MATLGSLVVHLAVDTARFQGDLGRAAAVAESRMRNIKDTATRALGAVSVVATAAGGALLAMFKAGVNRADEFRDMAQAVGLTVESLSRLDFAARQSGLGTEELRNGLRALNNNIEEAARKGGQAAEPFRALGIELRDASGQLRSADDILAEVAERFAEFEDGANKTAIASALFGAKLGAQMIPLLNEGRDGLKEMSDQADRLGVTISQKTADAADQFNDNLGVLRATMDGFNTSLAAELLPTLNNITGKLADTAEASQGLDRAVRVAAAGVKVLLTGGTILVGIFDTLGTVLGAVGAALVAFAERDFGRMVEIVKQGNLDIIANIKEIAESVSDIWADANEDLSEVVVTARKLAPTMRDVASAAKEAAKEYHSFAEDFARTQDAINQRITIDANRVMTKLQGETNRRLEKGFKEMSTFADQAARNMQDTFADFLFDPFDDGLRGMLSGFINVLRRMVAEAAAAKIFGSKSSGGLGFADFLIGGLGGLLGGLFKGGGSPQAVRMSGPLASGGAFSAGDMRVVGEHGPEMAVFGQGGTMVPNHALGGGVTVVQHIDMRNSTRESVGPATAAWKKYGEELKADIIDGIRSGKYPLSS